MAGIQLERRLSAQHLNVDSGRGVTAPDAQVQGGRTGIDGHGRRVLVNSETVVDIRAGAADEELFGGVEFVWCWPGNGDVILIDGEIVVSSQGEVGAFSGRTAADIEVGVIRHVDCSLLGAGHELSLHFDTENGNFLSRVWVFLSTASIDDLDIDSAWEAFISILAGQGELDTLPSNNV